LKKGAPIVLEISGVLIVPYREKELGNILVWKGIKKYANCQKKKTKENT